MKKLPYYLVVALVTIMYSCTEDDATDLLGIDEGGNISVFKGTQSPGDVWEWTLDHDNNTFTTVWDHGSFDDASDDITIKGTFTELASGYMKCTINDVSPANNEIPDDGTAFFYAMHLPDMAMIIKPEGSIKGDMISTVAAGDCADVPGEYNYIMIAPGNGETYDPVTEEAYGNVTIIEQGDGYTIHGEKFSLDCANGGACTLSDEISGLPTAVCTENGSIVISSQDATQVEGQFTGAGVMMLDMGMGNGGVLALQQDATFEFSELEGEEFVGFAYVPYNNNDKTVPVNVSFASDGSALLGTGRVITDINTGALAEESVSIRVDEIANGLALGDITHADGLGTNFVAALLESNGSRIIILSSTSSQDGDPFILVLVNKA